jgi:hypothetical protein
LLIRVNPFYGNDLKSEGVHDAGNHDKIGTGQIAGNHRWPAHDRDRDLARHQRRCGRRAAGNKEQLNIQTVLFEYRGFLSNPYRRQRTRLSAVTYVELLSY